MSENWLVKKAEDAMAAPKDMAPAPMPAVPQTVEKHVLTFVEPDHSVAYDFPAIKDSIKITINPGEENKNLEKIQKLVAKKNKEIEKMLKDFNAEVIEEIEEFAEELQDEFSKE
jgi:hypothetical protein